MNFCRTTAKVFSILVVLLATTSTARAMEVNINFLLGGKALDGSDWGEADSHGAFGIETTFGAKTWPVAVALDYIVSAHVDDVPANSIVPATVEVVQGTLEFDAGVRRIWKAGKARPYVGGGFASIAAFQEVPAIGLLTVDDSDESLGLWFNGGAFWRLGRKFNIGVDFRVSRGKVSLFGRDVQAGGTTLGLLLGWGWGEGGP